jgi:hypothetical protein
MLAKRGHLGSGFCVAGRAERARQGQTEQGEERQKDRVAHRTPGEGQAQHEHEGGAQDGVPGHLEDQLPRSAHHHRVVQKVGNAHQPSVHQGADGEIQLGHGAALRPLLTCIRSTFVHRRDASALTEVCLMSGRMLYGGGAGGGARVHVLT